MSFLPIAIIAYILAAGSIVADKIMLKRSVSSPLVYTFFVNVLQFLVIFLIPFGFVFTLSESTYLAIASGVFSFAAIYTFFVSLKHYEASIAGPLIGVFNPFFALLLEGLFLHQLLTSTQYTAVLILMVGAVVFTHNQWSSKLKLDKALFWMIISGLLFAIAFVLLRQTFLQTSFVSGLVISRLAAGICALSLILIPSIRRQILSHRQNTPLSSRPVMALMLGGQVMGGMSGLLISFGITLASASLVNSLFGVQYLVILLSAIFLARKFPHVLDEELNRRVIVQKIIGVAILSIGLGLLAK